MTLAPPALRVLQVNSLFTGGGADNQTLELALGLAALGDDVTLSVPAGSRWEMRARNSGLRVETFPPRSPLKLATIWSWIRLIRGSRIQVIHAHQGRDYWPAILAARLAGRGTRVVVTRHLMTRPRRLTRWLLLRLANVVAVSRAVLGVLERELRGPRARLHQVHCGINVNAFVPGRDSAAESFRQAQGWGSECVIFGVVGMFGLPRGKGQIEFTEAAARVRAQFSEARFAIVGRGSMEPLLRERMAALGVEDVVKIVPFTDDILPVMHGLDVLVHPPVGTDAFPLVVLEAMACGKPVVASRIDGIPEECHDGEHGFLVPRGDVAALADAMKKLLEQPALRDRFGQAGRERVSRNFSREILARRIREIYDHLLTPP